MTSFLLKQALTNPLISTHQNGQNNSWQQKTSTFVKFSAMLTNPLRTHFEEPKDSKGNIKH